MAHSDTITGSQNNRGFFRLRAHRRRVYRVKTNQGHTRLDVPLISKQFFYC
jgi:hypothetical protein